MTVLNKYSNCVPKRGDSPSPNVNYLIKYSLTTKNKTRMKAYEKHDDTITVNFFLIFLMQ